MKRAAVLLMVHCAISASAVAQTETIFGDAVPAVEVVNDPNAVTLGVKFYSTMAGVVSGVRFYRGANNLNGYRVRLYTAGGLRLGRALVAGDTCAIPCWESVNFASPIPIQENTTYIAAYYTSNGYYAADDTGFINGVMNGPLVVPASGASGGNGVYTYSTGFPNQTYEQSNYWVDVLFTPNAPPPPTLSLSLSPVGPSSFPDDSPVGTLLTTAMATWSDGSPFTGTYGLLDNDNGLCAISGNQVTLGAPFPNDGPQSCTVSATQ